MEDQRSSDPFITGDLIENRYRIDDRKSGMMGIVYLCTDIETGCPIAFKTFKDKYLNSEKNRKKFIDESSMWIRLDSHPNIVRAYYLKSIEGKLHLAIERILPGHFRGATLKDLIFSRPLTLQSMIQIGVHICDGMIHAISKFPYLVHRDLKSENILIGENLLPKITDFGMTQRLEQIEEESPRSFFAGKEKIDPAALLSKMQGTPAFASPEQCLCKALDTRSDIYSVGCVLYHLATARLPLPKATVEECIRAHIFETPTPPSQINSRVSPSFSKAIMTCLEKPANNRYFSFADLRRDLMRIYINEFGVEPISYPVGAPLSPDEYLERARSFYLIGELDHSLEELTHARELSPNRGDVLFELGNIHLQMNELRKAIGYFEMARSLLPENAELLEIMGTAYTTVKLRKEAETCFRSAIRLAPDHPSLYLKFAEWLIEKDAFWEAEKVLLQGAGRCGDCLELHKKLATYYRMMRNPLKEREYLKAALKETPNDSETLLLLAESYLAVRDRRQAQLFADKALESEFHSFDLLYRIGLVYKTLDNPSKNLEAWSRAARMRKGDGAFERDMSELYFRQRMFDEAWDHLLKAEEAGLDAEALKRKIQAARLKLSDPKLRP
ncbi:MAG: protein kinase [Candidatus Omnitrophota bacterium]